MIRFFNTINVLNVSLILMACLLSGNASSQQKIHYLSELELDGSPSEWNESFHIGSFTQHQKFARLSNRFKLYAAWNENNLFLLFDVTDKNLVTLKKQDSLLIHLNDAIEIFIDPLNDSKKTMDVNDYQFIVSIDGKQAILKGDKRLIDSGEYTAPKEFGISTLVFQQAIQLKGTINHIDEDEGYVVECMIPFSGIGIVPQEGIRFKLDLCVDDADSTMDLSALPDSSGIPLFYYSSWKGSRDFSYPDQWLEFSLTGKAPEMKSFFKRYYVEITTIGTLIFSIALLILLRLWLKLRKLRQLPKQEELIVTQDAPNEQNDSKPSDFHTYVHLLSSLDEKSPVLEKCKQFILSNLDRDISVDELAMEAAMSTRSLQRLFKEELNLSPVNFIVVLKMEEASKLILDGLHNINEVAYKLGYTDVSYFGKIFKRYFGFAPSAYLKIKLQKG